MTPTEEINEYKRKLVERIRAKTAAAPIGRAAGDGSLHPLVRRFHRCRWSDTRKRMDALEVGESFVVSNSEFNNATTSVGRLREAYEGTRRWRMKKVAAGWRVERVAPNVRTERSQEAGKL